MSLQKTISSLLFNKSDHVAATKLLQKNLVGLNIWPSIYLSEDKVDGAATVDVNEVSIDLLLQQLGTSGHGVWVSPTKLKHQLHLQLHALKHVSNIGLLCSNCNISPEALVRNVFMKPGS